MRRFAAGRGVLLNPNTNGFLSRFARGYLQHEMDGIIGVGFEHPPVLLEE